MNIEVWNLSHKGSLDKGKHFFLWGQTVERQLVNDKLSEWEYQDSAGYNLPYNPDVLQLSKVLKSKADLEITRLAGYVQDNFIFNDSSAFALQAGVRYNYNTLNNQLLISPRVGLSWRPANWKRDVIFRGAVGAYHQPPFYRELRRYDGTINEDLKAQQSWQAVAGLDYNF